MRICPNESCPFRLRFQRPADYQDAAAVCSDCGTALVAAGAAAAPVAPSRAPAAWSPDLRRRVWISGGVLLAVVAGSLASLPGLQQEVYALRSPGPLTLLSVGWSPFFSAMLLVELAAMAVPSWRTLREDGRHRALRRVALGIGLVFAAIQSVASVESYARAGLLEEGSVASPGAPSRYLLMAILFGGSAFTLLAAWVASERGLGAGFALVVLGDRIAELWRWLLGFDASRVRGVLLAAALGAAMVWLFRRSDRATSTAGAGERPRELPFPVAGLLPVLFGRMLLFNVLVRLGSVVPALEGAARSLPASRTAFGVAEAVIGVNLTIAFGILFHRPSRVAAAWTRWRSDPGPPRELLRAQVAARVRAMLPGAIAWSAAVVAVWVLPRLLEARETAGFDAVRVIAMVAIAMDLLDEVRARGESELATAWVLVRPYEIEPVLEALRAGGVKASIRGRRARAATQLLGPLLPIDVLVPPAQVERARELLQAGQFEAGGGAGSVVGIS